MATCNLQLKKQLFMFSKYVMAHVLNNYGNLKYKSQSKELENLKGKYFSLLKTIKETF